MSDKLDRVLGKKESSSAQFVEYGGTFQCQFCDEFVNVAKFFPNEYVLMWECSEGHKSFIEEFSG